MPGACSCDQKDANGNGSFSGAVCVCVLKHTACIIISGADEHPKGVKEHLSSLIPSLPDLFQRKREKKIGEAGDEASI